VFHLGTLIAGAGCCVLSTVGVDGAGDRLIALPRLRGITIIICRLVAPSSAYLVLLQICDPAAAVGQGHGLYLSNRPVGES